MAAGTGWNKLDENSQENEAGLAAPAPVAASAAPAFDPRRRIRELLSIPDRDRTDAEWDELNELEIQTAPGNRVGGNQPFSYPSNSKPSGFHSKNRSKGKGKPGGQGGPRPQQQGKPNNKPPRPGPV